MLGTFCRAIISLILASSTFLTSLQQISFSDPKRVFIPEDFVYDSILIELPSELTALANKCGENRKKALEICRNLYSLLCSPPGGKTVELSFCRLNDGISYEFNADKSIYGASLVKASYILMVLKSADEYLKNAPRAADGSVIYYGLNNKYDFSREFVYNRKEHFYYGTGKIVYSEDGTVYTYKQLIEYALLYSDNVAFKALRDTFGYGSYYAFGEKLGTSSFGRGNYTGMSAHDAVLFLRDMYEYFSGGSDNAVMMRDCMLRSDCGNMIQKAVSPDEAPHKYGRDYDAFHDMAIVYGKTPYAIAILTDITDLASPEDSEEYICNIASAVHRLNDLIE
ncbi:MAG: serine hydrolase [Firmicutes bacterium]|nr:serine hydrolase [Bacillota bacterium]